MNSIWFNYYQLILICSDSGEHSFREDIRPKLFMIKLMNWWRITVVVHRIQFDKMNSWLVLVHRVQHNLKSKSRLITIKIRFVIAIHNLEMSCYWWFTANVQVQISECINNMSYFVFVFINVLRFLFYDLAAW